MTQIAKLEQAIVALEGQRATLGDTAVDAAIVGLRQKLAGLRASATSTEEQRKQVTVLFADVSGFTAMSETLDAEVVRDTMNALWQRLDVAIMAQDGVIDKHIGDAVMALWGAPAAREDDPERAIRAALAMQQEIHAFVGATLVVAQGERAVALGEHKASPLQLRIGINTGPVMLGAVGTTAEFTAMGDAVNLASRLEHAAPVGGILISHDTYRQVRGIFDVTPQDPLTVKGKHDPVKTYIVQRAKPRAFRMATRGVEGIETRTVGRAAELLALQNAFRTATAPRIVTVVGDAGVGKSRLLYEFENWLELLPDQILFLKGRSYPELTHTPYSVLRDLFRYRFDIRESDSAAVVREKFEAGVSAYLDADRAHLVGHLVGFDFSATTAVQNLIGSPSFGTLALADLTNYFRGLTADNQVVMLLEDIHWADNATLDLIAHLAAELADHRLLIVCPTRPVLYEFHPAWGQGPQFWRLNLRPLSPDDSRALVGEILQKVDHLPDDLRELVVSSAEGYPFYVEELIKMLIEDGVIERGQDSERWQIELDRLRKVRVPPTLMGILQARLDSLPYAEKELLQRASVVGRQFWDATVASLSQAQLDSIRSTLDVIRARELVFMRERSAFAGAQEYIFKHALLRDVTYETVLLKLRRVYHQQVARWLEEHCGERQTEYAGLIAEHYERGEDTAHAAIWLRRAGEAAFQTGAFAQAVAVFERALALLPAGDLAGQAALLVKLGQAHTNMSDYQTAAAKLQAGLELARQAGDAKIAADAICKLSLVYAHQGRYAEGRALGEQALASARATGDRATCAQALRPLAMMAYYEGDYATTRQHLEEALALCREVGDRRGISESLNSLGVLFLYVDDHATAIQHFQDSLTLNRSIGDRQGIAGNLTNLGICFQHQGNHAQARRCYEESLAIYREIGRQQGIATDLINLGEVFAAQADYAQAIEHEEQALAIARKIGDRYQIALCTQYLGTYVAGLGDDEKAARYLREALAENQELGARPRTLETLVALAGLATNAQRAHRAAEWLGLALNHPASHREVTQAAAPILSRLRAVLPADELKAALERGQSLDLDSLVNELLAELDAESQTESAPGCD